nr:saccharopine dehydrogenase C-terminal domain-containing protein [Chryseosolibacter indicus]
MECGFAAGLDHITAKKAIDNIHIRGGRISSFKSYSGNILAEDSIDNPLEFKLIDTAADTIQIGRQTNRQLIKGKISHIPYQHLFERAESIKISGLKDLSVIPEGDALYCKKIYQLNEADTVVKGRILRSEFEQIWRLLINLGMTDPHPKIEMFEFASYYNFLDSLLPYSEDEHLETRLKKFINATEEDILKLRWLGLFDDEWINAKDPTPATLLQHLLEKKFAMDDKDKDCIIMQHQMEYILKGVKHRMKATLVAQGENKTDSATAKAIGLTTGAAAKAFLLDNIKVKGLFIPTTKDIYEPILAELVDLGVGFHVEETIVQGYSIDEERIINV